VEQIFRTAWFGDQISREQMLLGMSSVIALIRMYRGQAGKAIRCVSVGCNKTGVRAALVPVGEHVPKKLLRTVPV
jgi:hypothetical protein